MSLPTVDKTLAKLSELIDSGRFEELETDTLEIKNVPSAGGEWRERYKTANAFLNTRGGILILGVKEEGQGGSRHYVHTGWQPHAENPLKELPKKFTDKDGRALDLPDAFPPPEIIDFRGGKVLVQLVDELPADRKFVFFGGEAFRRVVTGDHKLTPKEIDEQEAYREEALTARELEPLDGLAEADLSLDKLNKFILQLNQPVSIETLKPDLEHARPFLARRKFVVEGKVTILGALVCASHPDEALGFRAHVHCYVDVPQEVARDKQDFVDDVLKLMESSFGYLLRNTQRGISTKHAGVSVGEYPEALLRETMNNALAHRDYAVDRQVIVAVKPGSHVSIQNPGRFRSHLLIERDDEIPLRRILPEARARNPKLADVLRVFRKWEGRGIGMATLVNLCLANSIDLPYYSLGTDEVRLNLARGKLLDDRMDRLFKAFGRYIEDKLHGGSLSTSQKLVLSYLIKSEWANELVRYTVLLTPDNNHFRELRTLELAGLVTRHSASTATHPVYVPDRTLMHKGYVDELRGLFGTRFDDLSGYQKEVLGVVYRFDRFSKAGAVSAKEASFELWTQRGGADDIKAFDAFYTNTRRVFNRLESAGLVSRKGRRGFGLRTPTTPRSRNSKSRPPKSRANKSVPWKDLASRLFDEHKALHTVDAVRKGIGLPDTVRGRNQARNILVRLHNEGVIRRVRFGVYARAPRK